MNYRFPVLTGGTASQQLQQLGGFLYQLVEQLNMAEAVTERTIEEAKAAAISAGTDSRSDAQKAADTFQSIKSLIIKSADIVTAYEEAMQKTFNGLYVAQSDYGTFVQKTQADIAANSTGIEQNYSNLQAISGTVDALSLSMVEVNARIKTGLLDSSVTPAVYGVEVGQEVTESGVTVFKKYARFTADRLSFYDAGGSEVAYISDDKLYITQAEITGSLIIGSYVVESSNGIVFKWKG